MSVRFWRSAGHFGEVIKHCLCISREICTVPSLYRPSTNGLTRQFQVSNALLTHGSNPWCFNGGSCSVAGGPLEQDWIW